MSARGMFVATLAVAAVATTGRCVPGQECVPLPELARWESQMTKFGRIQGDRLAVRTAVQSNARHQATYYDAIRVYYQIADYTKDKSWERYAELARRYYRDEYVLRKDVMGAVPGFWNFTHGLLMDFQRTQDPRSREAVVWLSERAAYASDSSPLDATKNESFSREVAYTIISYINAERLGESRRERLLALVDQALGHIHQWFVAESSNNWAPFMFALTAGALIDYYEHVKQDQRIVAALQRGADSIWAKAWISEKEAFVYRADDPANAAPDLNLLIAPVFAWLYLKTDDPKHRDRGDSIFAGGVRNAWLDSDKQFNQNYYWSFDYVRWRTDAELGRSQPRLCEPSRP